MPEITQENENIEPEAQPETEHTEHIEAHIETLAHTEPEHIQQMQQEVSEESIHIHVQEANSVNDETDVAMSDLMVSSLEGVSIPTVGRKKEKIRGRPKGSTKTAIGVSRVKKGGWLQLYTFNKMTCVHSSNSC